MTKNDAIICLKGIKSYGRDTFTEQSDWQECLDMAIEVLQAYEKIIEQIDDEADYAYANFEEYKYTVLGAEPDDSPDDDFRYGMKRAIDIIRSTIRSNKVLISGIRESVEEER